jgi:protein-disulfide isomerase
VLEKFSGKVKLISKHYPLSYHDFAKKAAAAAVAANEQGKFWSYHQELLKNYKNLNDKRVREIAVELGLDMTKFKRDMASPATETRIGLDMKYGREKDVPHLPSVYVNGKFLKDPSVKNFSKAIRAELARKR